MRAGVVSVLDGRGLCVRCHGHRSASHVSAVWKASARLPMWRVAVMTESEGWASYAAEQERYAETARRLERLRDAIAHLHDIYASPPGEPKCCSDCAANDISDELRRILRDV